MVELVTDSQTSEDMDKNNSNDVALAHLAGTGDETARQLVIKRLHPLVWQRTIDLCKKFCGANRKLYKCTLDSAWGLQDNVSASCDYGHGSYTWMMDDLISNKRLLNYQGRNGASLLNYLTTIAYSHMFKERWKDWRWQRRNTVPDYIKDLDVDAKKVFWWLCDRDTVPNIAQRLQRKESEIKVLKRRIIAELQKRGYSYRLEPDITVSLGSLNNSDDTEDASEWDIPVNDNTVEIEDLRKKINEVWNKLEWKEQFVLEMMIVEEMSAKAVLKALREEGISLQDDLINKECTEQQVYYFTRKTLAKLKAYCDL